MIRKVMGYKLWVISFVVFISLAHRYCYAQSIPSSELINNTKLYDGKVVVYEGEIIGDIMARRGFAWINLNDGLGAIGIWADQSLTRDLVYTGSYKSRGDWLEITGIFHRACPEHGGDLDIHAQGMRKVKSGRLVVDRLNLSKRNLAFILAGVLCLVWILGLLKSK
ncbi:MAG: DNA-binding protein [Candidatus Omnitrophota bacterium]